MRIAITGASGLIGTALTNELRKQEHEVIPISRTKAKGTIVWDIANKTIDKESLEGVDAVVHLAGENITGLWTAQKKRRIERSRIESTDLLATTLPNLKKPPHTVVSASAIGYYGLQPGEVDESAPPGKSFLAGVCTSWEAAAKPLKDAGIRVVHPRISMVLAREGGALKQMLPSFKLGAGAKLGNGKQGMSWIALDDVARAIAYLLEQPTCDGAYNLSAPGIVNNAEFTKTLAGVLRRPSLFSVPEMILKAAAGDLASELLLNDIRAYPKRLQEAGFAFTYPELRPALESLLQDCS